MVERSKLVAVWRAVTRALGTLLPLWSTTVPRIVPRETCPLMTPPNSNASDTTTQLVRQVTIIETYAPSSRNSRPRKKATAALKDRRGRLSYEPSGTGLLACRGLFPHPARVVSLAAGVNK